MILSYSKKNVELFKFPEKIKSGIKIHTLRADPHNRWKIGNSIQHSTGLRTKNYNCFLKGECKGIQNICLSFVKGGKLCAIIIGDQFGIPINAYGLPLPFKFINICSEISLNDGFDNFKDFELYFYNLAINNIKGNKLKEAIWHGNSQVIIDLKIIHFTDFLY